MLLGHTRDRHKIILITYLIKWKLLNRFLHFGPIELRSFFRLSFSFSSFDVLETFQVRVCSRSDFRIRVKLPEFHTIEENLFPHPLLATISFSLSSTTRIDSEVLGFYY